ncbi:MAG: hypothetical protein H7Y05_07540 [Steroidobacteraceae bacterium]|nr:hypothetical protein [Deltaproteobacteria bacterium]
MKKSSALAAVLTLGIAATATSAFALENEFHGLFSARWINSNFNGTQLTGLRDTPTLLNPTPGPGPQRYGGNGQYEPGGLPKTQYSANIIEQRARLQYIAKANADLKLVTHFEIDYVYWGNSSYATGRNQGGAIGADSVNFETKSIYLDANPCKNVNMKLGMMPNNDAFKGVMFDADMAGLLLSSSYNSFTPSFGVFRFADTGLFSSDNVIGHKTSDMVMLDGKFAVSKDLKVGGAYYLFRDNSQGFSGPNQDIKMNALGVNAEVTGGPLTLNGFAIFETGTVNKSYTNGFAGNLGAKLKVGPGTARTEFLYTSGDNNPTDGHGSAFYGVTGQLNAEHGYYDNEMVILGRDKNAYTTDNAIIFSSNNKNQGQIGGYIGFDLPINAKLTTAFNAGFAAVAKDNSSKPINLKTGAVNKSNYLGTEINAEANYQLLEGLTTSVRTAYVVLGDYYKDVAINGTPENPYDFKLIFKYTF